MMPEDNGKLKADDFQAKYVARLPCVKGFGKRKHSDNAL